MRGQRTYSTVKKAGLGPRRVVLAALAILLTATAASQTQPNTPANTQAERPATTPTNQTRRPAATSVAQPKQPTTPATTAPKPSMLDKARSLFGMKKSSPDAPKSEQSHSFFDKFRSHPNSAEKPNPGHPERHNQYGAGRSKCVGRAGTTQPTRSWWRNTPRRIRGGQ